MSSIFRAVCSSALLVSAAGAAWAQAASAAGPAPARSAAASAVAPVTAAPPSAGYRSAFDGFRRFADQPVGSWREANDTVGRVGGWRAYAREAQGTDVAEGHGGMAKQPVGRAAAVQPAASSPGPAAAPARDHSGHGTK